RRAAHRSAREIDFRRYFLSRPEERNPVACRNRGRPLAAARQQPNRFPLRRLRNNRVQIGAAVIASTHENPPAPRRHLQTLPRPAPNSSRILSYTLTTVPRRLVLCPLNLLLRLQPIVEFSTILTSTLLVNLIGPPANLFFHGNRAFGLFLRRRAA